MNKKTSIIIIVVVILVGGYFLLNKGDQAQLGTPAPGNLSVNEKEVVTSDVVVQIRNHKLDTTEITIPAGGTVTWINEDNLAGFPYSNHSPTSGSIDPTGMQGKKGVVAGSGSGIVDGTFALALGSNKSLSHTFPESGTYAYYIAEHPLISGEGKITVEAVEIDVGAQNEVRTVRVTARQWEFVPNTITLSLGEKVQLVITNEDVPHGFAIPALGISELLSPGATHTIEFTATERGTFPFFCNVSCGVGHGGMKGELIVE